MKTPVYVSLIVLAFLVGCGDKPKQSAATPPSSGTSPTPMSAPGDYANALVSGQTKALKTVDIASLNQAIQMFNVQEGRFPKNLDELVEQKLIVKIPDAPYGMKLDYDPATGKISMVKAD
jgi:hypothetical protein